MQFQTLPFYGKWKELIGEPSANFFCLVWGLPKNGKSYLCYYFSDYMSRFAPVLYCLAEEGISVTTQKKIRETGLDKNTDVYFMATKSLTDVKDQLDSGAFGAVFFYSINLFNITADQLEDLRRKYTETAFICIVQSTKTGNFRGSQEWSHNADVLITVEAGFANSRGRFGAGEMEIFPLLNLNQF
jgi:predicted ATP-dependent serine protease